MPVIVVGADTPVGEAIVQALKGREGEVRAFVSDVDTGLGLKQAGVKVAIGDVSDASHVGGAAMQCFSAVLVPDAAFDDRERSFAEDAAGVLAGWAEALRDGGVKRAIVLEDDRLDLTAVLEGCTNEIAYVAPGPHDEVAREVARLDDLASL